MTASRNNKGKPQLHHILYFQAALNELAKVCEFGCSKYSKHNWEEGANWTSAMDSALRHISKWINKKELDDESDLPHLAHAAWNILAVLTWQLKNKGEDDR